MTDAGADADTDFGLSGASLRALRTVLSAHREVVRADIYGSRAVGRFRTGSDIDMTLRGELLTMNDLLLIDREIDELDLPYKIDLSLYSQIEDPALRDHIDRIGRPLYEAVPSR
ncbi:nucleotidyltransferase domain-containing protein [Variovorax sp. RHLX14]|uniref:nucleotidyltransferase domain-containing protein n=1 Tax=Variovorax sp. RHLX14 TaxID=1259731 RepID=UPI003F461AD0